MNYNNNNNYTFKMQTNYSRSDIRRCSKRMDANDYYYYESEFYDCIGCLYVYLNSMFNSFGSN